MCIRDSFNTRCASFHSASRSRFLPTRNPEYPLLRDCCPTVEAGAFSLREKVAEGRMRASQRQTFGLTALTRPSATLSQGERALSSTGFAVGQQSLKRLSLIHI